jgi:rhodanese-related sulfurtransferase
MVKFFIIPGRRFPRILFWTASLTLGCALSGSAVKLHAAPQAEVMQQKNAARKADVNEFEKLWKDKKSVVLDVRTDKEFAAGHIPGALNLNFHGTDFEKKVAALNKDRTYLVHCAAGVRSAKACEVMTRLGFTNLVDLPSGFKGWEKAGKPVQR